VVTVPIEPQVTPPARNTQTKEIPAIKIVLDAEDEAPLPDVPPLPRTGEYRAIKNGDNNKPAPPKDDTEN